MIKGLTDKPQIPRAGKVRLGMKVKTKDGKSERPVQAGYFVVHPDDSTRPEAAEAFKQAYGESPTELEVIFHSNDIEEIFPQSLKYYKGAQIFCAGDGEKASRFNAGRQVYEPYVCKFRDCPDYISRSCRPVGNLKFFIPAVNTPGMWQLDVRSTSSIKNINGGLNLALSKYGQLIGVTFKLCLYKTTVNANGAPIKAWLVQLMPEGMAGSKPKAEFEAVEFEKTPVEDEEKTEEIIEDAEEEPAPEEAVLEEPIPNEPAAETQPQQYIVMRISKGKIKDKAATAVETINLADGESVKFVIPGLAEDVKQGMILVPKELGESAGNFTVVKEYSCLTQEELKLK